MQKVKDTLDKNGEHVEIWHNASIAGTPALSLFLKVYAEIVDNGFAIPVFLFNNEDRVVWAQRPDGKILGGISYEYQKEKRSGWLVLSFTDPAERGKGINQLCHDAYEDDCKKLGATCLESMVHVDNTQRIKSAAKVGMVPKYYRMYKQL